MKKYIKSQFAIIAAVCTILLPGCNDFLDTIPDNRVEIDNMDKIHKILCKAYPERTYVAMLEARCEGMIDFGVTRTQTPQSESFEFLRGGFYWMPHSPADNDDSHKRFWEASYNAISYCNTALDALEKYGAAFDPSEVKLVRAEAKIARAYNHFMLLTMFTNMFDHGNEVNNPGIPYVEEAEDIMFKQYKRGTVAGTLEKIKKDLFEEINNIGVDADYTKLKQQPKFHFTRNAAYAFAVRYCLFTEDYEGVIRYSKNLIAEPTTYTAASGTNSIDGSPKIYIAETDAVYQEAKRLLFDNVVWKSSLDNYSAGQLFSNPENPSYYLMVEAETLAWRAFLGTRVASFAYNLSAIGDIAGNNPTGGSYAYPIYVYSNDPSHFVAKYYEDMLMVDEVAKIGYVYNKINLFRLEEVLLARAEAYAMLGDFQKSIDNLNVYLQRKIEGYYNNPTNYRLDKDKVINKYNGQLTTAFVGNEFNARAFNQSGDLLRLQKALIMSITGMRRAEFFTEGMGYIDALRWNIPIKHVRNSDNVSRTLYPDDDNRILQLPETTVLSGLAPNPMKKIQDPWPGVIYE